MPEAPRPPHNANTPVANATRPASGTDTVICGCKLPHGIKLQRFIETEQQEDMMGGGKRIVKVYRPTNETFRLNGTALPLLRDPGREYPLIINGTAYTFGVPADLWHAWHETMKNEPMVTQGLVFAAAQQSDVDAMARDSRDQPTGMEPISPQGDVRMPRHISTATAV